MSKTLSYLQEIGGTLLKREGDRHVTDTGELRLVLEVGDD